MLKQQLPNVLANGLRGPRFKNALQLAVLPLVPGPGSACAVTTPPHLLQCAEVLQLKQEYVRVIVVVVPLIGRFESNLVNKILSFLVLQLTSHRREIFEPLALTKVRSQKFQLFLSSNLGK